MRILITLLALLLLASCSRHDDMRAQGYVEGRYTYIATPVGGHLMQLGVKRGDSVSPQQLLFTLSPQPEIDQYQAALDSLKQSKAMQAATLANFNFAKLTFERNQDLVGKKAVSISAVDQSRASYLSYQAQLAQANAEIAVKEANVLATEWTKNQKNVFAPVSAVVFDTYYRHGEYVVANQPVMALLASEDIKIIFYVGEPVLSHLVIGQPLHIRCDGCEKDIDAKISFISPSAEYTPPVIYSNETNAKLIYRIEAALTEENAHLHPGQPVMVAFQRNNKNDR